MAPSTLTEARQSQADLVRSFESIARNRQAPSASDIQSLVASRGSGMPASNLFGMNRQTTEAYRMFRDWTYTIINFLSKRIASQPWNAGELLDATPNPERSSPRRKAALSTVPSNVLNRNIGGEDLEVFASHPALDVLARPNAIQNKFAFLYMAAANLLLTGEAYWIGGVVEDGDIDLYAVPSSWIKPIHKDGPFSGFMLQVRPEHEPTPLDNSVVARTYFPDPSDILAAYSPLRAIIRAIKSDDRIQDTQLRSLQEGLDPKIVVSVGRVRGPDGKLTDRRPVLKGHQRRQIIRAIREIMSRSIGGNEPAIVDGMIENITKLSTSPAELDFPGSGRIIKARIEQAYGVNPIVLGEIVGANRAQAVVANENVNTNAINPIVGLFSESMTDFLGPMFTLPERLLIWLSCAVSRDPAQVLREWSEARRNGDVTRDEFRAHVLDQPPLDDVNNPHDVMANLSGITGLLSAVGRAEVRPEQAAKILELSGFDKSDAESMAGVGGTTPIGPGDGTPSPPPPDDSADEEEQQEDGTRTLQVQNGTEIGPNGSIALLSKSGTKRSEFRKAIAELHVKQLARAERELIRELIPVFNQTVRLAVANFQDAAAELEFAPESATEQANSLMIEMVDQEQVAREIAERSFLPLVKAFAEGGLTELEANAKFLKQATTAEEMAARLETELPSAIALQMPSWMIDQARTAVNETFEQPYWREIPTTISTDIRDTLENGIREGLSTRRVAQLIMEKHGSAYSKIRATLVARTELPSMSNAGHDSSIAHVAEETGLDIRKMWLSVNQTFTRPEHSALDGTTADDEGMFDVDGFRAPWPAHWNLPAAHRCNCLCVIISSAV